MHSFSEGFCAFSAKHVNRIDASFSSPHGANDLSLTLQGTLHEAGPRLSARILHHQHVILERVVRTERADYPDKG
jgi:hypothetical protein